MRGLLLALLPLSIVLVSCNDKGGDEDEEDEVEEELPGVGALGHETHSLDNVQLTVVGTEDDGLNVPRDLDFNPDYGLGQLWVVNRDDDSVSIFFDPDTDAQESDHRIDPFAMHFMEEVSSISFGAPTWSESDELTFGTCQESRNTYNGQQAPNGFMGPTLWTADLDWFAESNPAAVEYLSELFGFHVDLGSHLDMLHESPFCMGIEWGGTDNHYWVFDGGDSSISFYDFAADHDIGFDDHSDGIVIRYAKDEVKRLADVPSHLVLDESSGLLYIADTGNGRVAVLDTETGEPGDEIRANEPGVTHYEMEGADIWTLVDGEDHGMTTPSGIELVEDHLLVTDNTSGTIFAFDLEGNLVDHLQLEVPEGALMGLVAPSLDDIWLVDAVNNELLRLQAQ